MKKNILFLILGFLLSFLLFTTIRFVNIRTNDEHETHFHANFALFIDGNKFDYSKDKYKEEISSCDVTTKVLPKQRVHLHNNVADLVHVHHEGVTWGHLFSNLGFVVGNTVLVDDSGKTYQNTDDKKLTFILNGNKVDSIYNKQIVSEDKLLINFGNETIDVLKNERFSQVASSAKEANNTNDPATCSGVGNKNLTFWEKVKKAALF